MDLNVEILDNLKDEAQLAEALFNDIGATLVKTHPRPSCDGDGSSFRDYEVRVRFVSRVQLRVVREVRVGVRPACVIVKTAHQVVEIVCPIIASGCTAISELRAAWSSCISLRTAHSILIIERAVLAVGEGDALMAIERVTCPQVPCVEEQLRLRRCKLECGESCS